MNGGSKGAWKLLKLHISGPTFSDPSNHLVSPAVTFQQTHLVIHLFSRRWAISRSVHLFVVVVQGSGGSACGGTDDVGREDRGKLKAIEVDDRNGGGGGGLRPTKSELLLSEN